MKLRLTPLHYITVLTLFMLGASAQRIPQSAGSTQPPAAEGAPAAEVPAPQMPTIISNVNLVNIPFSVQNAHGGFVAGLTRDNFRVLEDGRPQTIKYFSAENSVPLTLGWLIDTSPSQQRVLTTEQQVSDQFFDQVLTPKDLAFVLGFDVDTTVLQDLTASKQLLKNAVDSAHIGGGEVSSVVNPGPFPTTATQGAIHLWDAIYLACQDRLSNQVGRKAIVVVTDGVDEGSKYKDRDALRELLDSNTVLYAVVAEDRSFYGGFGIGFPGSDAIRRLADQSGGRSFTVSHGDMRKAFTQIADELRSQYSVAYQSDRPQLDGTYRKVKIELVNAPQSGLKVRARAGYYAEKEPPR